MSSAEVVRLVSGVSLKPKLSLRTIWHLPDVLVPPWLKMFHIGCNTMLPMHACALLSAAMVQLRSAEPLHLHPTSPQDASYISSLLEKVQKHSPECYATFLTDVPIVMQPADTHALRAALLNHALLSWFTISSKSQVSRKVKREQKGTTALADSVRKVILDVAALARMLDMCVAESSTVSSAATQHLARSLLESSKVHVKSLNLTFEPENPDWKSAGGARLAVDNASTSCTSPMHLINIAIEARERFSELEALAHRTEDEDNAQICMSGMYRGRPDWQREERLWGLRWLQVRATLCFAPCSCILC